MQTTSTEPTMVVQLQNPQLQQFLKDAVRAGRYPSLDAAIEAAVIRMEREDKFVESLDEETQAALDRADAAVARGEVRPWPEVRAELIRDLGLKI